jgi:hypothetical protein
LARLSEIHISLQPRFRSSGRRDEEEQTFR